MIKSRTAQIIYQTIYCTLGLVGTVAIFGIFDDVTNLRWDCYVHFTNFSNFFCLAIMFASLICTIRRKGDGYVKTAPRMKFMGMILILMTFLIFNGLLAGAEGRDPQMNWRVGSLIFHEILPVMYVAEWFLFYQRRRTRWYYPFAALIPPACYTVFIYVQAAILRFDTSILIPNTETPLIYPYFFLNLETQGVLGVGKWLLIILVSVLVIGYSLFGLDRIGRKPKNDE